MPKADVKPSSTAGIYARVSSKEREKEGFSVPTQLNLLRGYAADRRLTLIEECVEVETAKCVGRPGFIAMVGFFQKHGHVTTREGNCTVILVEKADRLYRNLKDWVTLDELDLEIHFVKDDIVLTCDSRSSEKFMHGIKVLKGRYIYYHCKGFQGKLPKPYTRKEDWP